MVRVKKFIKKIFTGSKEAGPLVAGLLGQLPEDYMVFSGILYNHSEIDHVVFNRQHGLFIINIAAGKGEVTYDGAQLLINRKPRSEVIKKTLKDTFWLKSTIRERMGLDVLVTPIVVFENAKVKVSGPIIGVTVVESGRLMDTVAQTPEKSHLEDGVVMVLRELHGIHTINYRSM